MRRRRDGFPLSRPFRELEREQVFFPRGLGSDCAFFPTPRYRPEPFFYALAECSGTVSCKSSSQTKFTVHDNYPK